MKPRLEDILDATLEVLNIDKENFSVNIRLRERSIVTVKQMVSLLGREYGFSLSDIGKVLQLNHSTVHWNAKTAMDYMRYEKEYAQKIQKIRDNLRKKFPALWVDNERESCCDCEVFKNRQGKEFLLGFHCPIMDRYVYRDEIACQYILSDGLAF